MTKTEQKRLKGRKLAMFESLKKELGIITAACNSTGLSRQTHYRWLKEDENYKIWIDTVPDVCLDFAENALFKLIQDRNVAATIFYLKTKGKKRGYIERPEQQFNFVNGDIPRVYEFVIDNGKGSNEDKTLNETA